MIHFRGVRDSNSDSVVESVALLEDIHREDAMKKRALQVALHAREPSIIELTVHERVQVDHITPSPSGNIAERHGALLEPGVNTLSLAQCHYFFKTLSDAHLHVVRGGVDPTVTENDKDTGWPDTLIPDARGDKTAGELPELTLE